ncbi:S-layer homology domain-containing protein [Brassicibacter mesophilus]|uniref:S-layer homology domain-containing protein n=1 Tax=Brassicibacter mesophilus TaxID=745119 RepID=UPI003D22652B
MKRKYLVVFLVVYVITFFNFETALANRYFFDTYGHWAEEAIIWGTNKVSLFNGYEDGTFKPNDSISRSEYISILCRVAKSQGVINDKKSKLMLDSTMETTDNARLLNYKDMSDSFWGYKDIREVAMFINNINGEMKFNNIFPGDKFEPNKDITREEAVMVSYFFITPAAEDESKEFSDINDNYLYKEQIYQLANNGIIEGYADNTFKPKNGITRGEAATIIKRIFDDMEYANTLYLNGIQLVESPDVSTYPLFGEYNSRKLEENDLLYKRAIETLEYESIVGTIPYEEKHLYDSNPVETLKKLKKSEYWNKIGVNYYLVKYDKMNTTDKDKLIREMIKSYLDGTIIEDSELMLVFREAISLGEDKNLILEGLNKWTNNATNNVYKYNSLYMTSEILAYQSQFEKAIKIYDIDLEGASFETQKKFFMNKAYIYLLDNNLKGAEATLREGWQAVKNNVQYFQNRTQTDKQFTGAIKEVLLQKKIYQNN